MIAKYLYYKEPFLKVFRESKAAQLSLSHSVLYGTVTGIYLNDISCLNILHLRCAYFVEQLKFRTDL